MVTFFVTISGNSPESVEMSDGTTIADVLEARGFPASQTTLIQGVACPDKSIVVRPGQNLFITRENKQGVL